LEYVAIFFQIFLYLGIIAVAVYWLFPPHEEKIDEYFQGKVVWITGASSGIGREIVKHLARLSPSSRLVISSRREDELTALAKELQLDADHCLVLPLDLEQHVWLQSKVDLILNIFGQIDILINNGGVSQRSFIRDTVYNVDSRLININYLGTITLSKSVLPHFIERQQGHFVVVTSVSGYIGTVQRSAYAGSKHALHGFFEALRLEHARDHIDVTMVCPGYINTDISRNAFEGSGVLHGILDPKTEGGSDPTVCALDILHGIAAKKREIYVGHMSAVIYARRFLPGLLYRILLRMNTV